MSLRRLILLLLLPIPIAILIASMLWPSLIVDNGPIESLLLLIAVPIVVFNAWEWQDPAFLDKLGS
jgi:hypothetical protein